MNRLCKKCKRKRSILIAGFLLCCSNSCASVHLDICWWKPVRYFKWVVFKDLLHLIQPLRKGVVLAEQMTTQELFSLRPPAGCNLLIYFLLIQQHTETEDLFCSLLTRRLCIPVFSLWPSVTSTALCCSVLWYFKTGQYLKKYIKNWSHFLASRSISLLRKSLPATLGHEKGPNNPNKLK